MEENIFLDTMLMIFVSFFFLMLMNLWMVFSFRDQSLGRILLLKFDKIIHIISIVFLANKFTRKRR